MGDADLGLPTRDLSPTGKHLFEEIHPRQVRGKIPRWITMIGALGDASQPAEISATHARPGGLSRRAVEAFAFVCIQVPGAQDLDPVRQNDAQGLAVITDLDIVLIENAGNALLGKEFRQQLEPIGNERFVAFRAAALAVEDATPEVVRRRA